MRRNRADTKFLDISSEEQFRNLCLETFRFQAVECSVYRRYLDELSVNPDEVIDIHDIPFLPIEVFKTNKVYSANSEEDLVFHSSGTSGMQTSKHYVAHSNIYEASFTKSFEIMYGRPEDYCFVALLPSYLERENSSLVYMMEKFIG